MDWEPGITIDFRVPFLFFVARACCCRRLSSCFFCTELWLHRCCRLCVYGGRVRMPSRPTRLFRAIHGSGETSWVRSGWVGSGRVRVVRSNPGEFGNLPTRPVRFRKPSDAIRESDHDPSRALVFLCQIGKREVLQTVVLGSFRLGISYLVDPFPALCSHGGADRQMFAALPCTYVSGLELLGGVFCPLWWAAPTCVFSTIFAQSCQCSINLTYTSGSSLFFALRQTCFILIEPGAFLPRYASTYEYGGE